LAFAGGAAEGAELKIVDLRAYAFLEHAATPPNDLICSDETMVDAPKGGARLGGDTATGLLLDFTFEATGTLPPSTRPRSST
jgi:hypothetical protein